MQHSDIERDFQNHNEQVSLIHIHIQFHIQIHTHILHTPAL